MDDLCPPLCHELWNNIYPSVYGLQNVRKNTALSCWIIFVILILVHGFEAIVLRMDETIFGENFINKVFGIKWGLLYRMTGSLYAGMADHFFNNCIATNLLHVITEAGVDEMMIIRVAIAQLLSFTIIMLVWKKF